MRTAFLFGVILSALAGSLSAGAVRRVPGEYPSIQQAISDCNDGDTVIVSPGVYYETINFSGKDITVTSTDPNDRGIVGYTIINADGDGTVVTFENQETNKAVLTGFTITGGVGTLMWSDGTSYKEFYGAGINCYNAWPTITHCVITRNHGPYYQRNDGATYEYAYSLGGGICCMSGGAVITHNTIYNNSAYEGGGMFASGATVSNNVIYNNSAAYGGGIYMGYGDLINNTIVNNDCSKQPEYGMGGNVFAYFDYSFDNIVANNVICGAKSGGGLVHYQAHGDLMRFNNVWDNVPANYGMEDARTYEAVFGDKADWTGRFGNISENPLFRNPAMNDFHLQPVSPCISAGDPNSLPSQVIEDIDGDPRVFALRVDMGADEHVGYVKPLADAGADQHVLAPEPITLDGANSYFSDPNGVKTYQWRQTQGTAVDLSDAAAQQPAFTPPAEGWYVFELVVGDGQHTSKPDRVLVVVGNEAPVANAGPDQLWRVPDVVTLDGSRSHDADPPDDLTYTWTQIEGPPVQLIVIDAELARLFNLTDYDPSLAYFECQTPGIYVFELVVSDGFTISAPDTVKIETSPFTIKSTALTLDAAGQTYRQYPAIAGAKVVCAAGQYTDSSWGIQCLDLETGRSDLFQGPQTDTVPKMDGDVIVWTAGPGGNYRPICTGITAVDITSAKPKSLRTGTSTDSYGYPAISGRKIVWLHHRGVNTNNATQYSQTPYEVCGADITDFAKPVYFTITEQGGHGDPYPYQRFRDTHAEPVDICGNLVVWEADGDIFGADISDLSRIKVFPICTAPERQYDPSISGHRVVWTDERNDMGDIYGAVISDPNDIREFEVYVGPGYQLQPDIDGQMIVYVRGNDAGGTIQLCCLSREYGPVPFALPEWSYGAGPELDGSMLVWQYSSRIQGVNIEFAYSPANGPVQNLTTGGRYDYIQHAVETAEANDVIMVPPGVYEEKLRLRGKGLILTSTDPEDPAVRAATVLAGSGQRVAFMDDETADCVFTGFTVTGGSQGIFCSGSSPTISNCNIVNNAYAGVKLWNMSDPTLSRCEITGNGKGAEMWAYTDRRPILRSLGTFRNCLIAGNRGSGVFDGNPTIENCTIADNLGMGIDSILATITNSIIYFNGQGLANLKLDSWKSTVTYSDVQGGWEGEGHLDADPLFVARGQWVASSGVAQPVGTGGRQAVSPGTPNWAGGDYHLQSQGWSWNGQQGAWAWNDVTSPCIDAGDPAALLGDEQLCGPGDPLSERAGPNTRINMGAYGGTAEASLAPQSQAPQP